MTDVCGLVRCEARRPAEGSMRVLSRGVRERGLRILALCFGIAVCLAPARAQADAAGCAKTCQRSRRHCAANVRTILDQTRAACTGTPARATKSRLRGSWRRAETSLITWAPALSAACITARRRVSTLTAAVVLLGVSALAQDTGNPERAGAVKGKPVYSPYAGRTYPTRPLFGDKGQFAMLADGKYANAVVQAVARVNEAPIGGSQNPRAEIAAGKSGR